MKKLRLGKKFWEKRNLKYTAFMKDCCSITMVFIGNIVRLDARLGENDFSSFHRNTTTVCWAGAWFAFSDQTANKTVLPLTASACTAFVVLLTPTHQTHFLDSDRLRSQQLIFSPESIRNKFNVGLV